MDQRNKALNCCDGLIDIVLYIYKYDVVVVELEDDDMFTFIIGTITLEQPVSRFILNAIDLDPLSLSYYN